MTAADGKWTVETLREHLAELAKASDRLSDERAKGIANEVRLQKEAVNSALDAANRAVAKAEAAMEKRFDGVNEFRSALADQQRTLMPRSEVDVIVKGLSDKIEAITGRQTMERGEQSGARAGWEIAVGVVGLIFIVLSIVALVATFRMRG